MQLTPGKPSGEDKGNLLNIENKWKSEAEVYLISIIVLFFFFPSPTTASAGERNYARGWSDINKIGIISSSSHGPHPLLSKDSEQIFLPYFTGTKEPRLAVFRMNRKGDIVNDKKFSKKLRSPRELTSSIGPRGNIHIVFVDEIEKSSVVYYASVKTDGQLELSKLSMISEPFSRIRSPELTVDRGGTVYVVWSEPEGSEYTVDLATIEENKLKTYEKIVPPGPVLDNPTVLPGSESAGAFLAWTEQGSHPQIRQVKFGKLSNFNDGVDKVVSVTHTSMGGDIKRRPQLIESENRKKIYLICKGIPEKESSEVSSCLLAKLNYEGNLLDILPLIESKGRTLSQPYGCLTSSGKLCLTWVQASKVSSPEIWNAKFDLNGSMISRPVYLSRSEGEINNRPVCRKGEDGEFFSFWTVVNTEDERSSFLMYRNTLYPTPVSVWRKIGISKRHPYMAIFYSFVYSAGIVPFGLLAPNILLIISCWILALVAKNYLFRKSARKLNYLYFLLPFSVLFCLFHPVNTLFIRTDLVTIAYLSPAYQFLQFSLASLITLFLAYRYEWSVDEPLSLLVGTLTWSYMSGFLLALPGTLSLI